MEAEGDVPGHPGLVWQWEVVPGGELLPLGAAVARLQVWERGADPGEPLVSVDLLTAGSFDRQESRFP